MRFISPQARGHLLYLVFFINLLILEPLLQKSRLFLDKAFKMVGDALKNIFVKWGIPPEGAASFISLGTELICPDRWAKEQKWNQINNRIALLDRKIQDFQYQNPEYSKLSSIEKDELNTWQKGLEDPHDLYQNTGGVMYQEICTMHGKFIFYCKISRFFLYRKKISYL